MNKSQSNLFSILIIVVSFIVGYLYYANLDTTVEISVDAAILKKSDLEEFKDLNINFSILDDQRLNDFTTYGENPVDPGPPGSIKDMFAPLP